SHIASTWMDRDGCWIIEGIATVRAIRKWLAAHPGEPLDATIVLLSEALEERTKEQEATAKGVATIWNGIVIEVLRRGARVINAASPKPVRENGEGTEASAAE
ncbi:MAG TPA: hypothetical protein VF014_12760, partial [Casimicrobiaceae bacterium]|nr:hypothetical protein [Casimicrobiaceae bacterium]